MTSYSKNAKPGIPWQTHLKNWTENKQQTAKAVHAVYILYYTTAFAANKHTTESKFWH